MPELPFGSSGSLPPSATPSAEPGSLGSPSGSEVPPKRLAWRLNAGLFVATLVSVFATTFWFGVWGGQTSHVAAREAVEFAASLLAILLAHEFGHFIAARVHRVDASLPYFIPLPLLSPFGTMGAVIRMRSVIPSRRALLDIGAAGPLAGLALAIPLYAWGVAHSHVASVDGQAVLGESLLVRGIDRIFAPRVPDGMDILLSPVANAAWAGMFITMINLLPLGQLDGGHVAYALFGPPQNRIARWVHRSLLIFFVVSVVGFTVRDVRAGFGLWHLGRSVGNSIFWLVWFEALAVLGSLTNARERRSGSTDGLSLRTRAFATVGLLVIASVLHDRSSTGLWACWFVALGVLVAMEARWGALRDDSALLDHPPTDAGGSEPLSPVRRAVAVVTLAFFVLLFMPTPFSL